MERRFFAAQNEAELFIDVLRTNTLAGKFKLHDFVVMPDHFHVLLTVDGNTSIERAVQILPLLGTFPQARPIQPFWI
jgi:putative transposase